MTPTNRSLAYFAVFAIVGSATPVGAAEFVEYYKVGLAAVESEDWDLVGEMMGRAIEIQPESKARIKKGLFFKRYLPHYYLGMSLYKDGDCVGALASWQNSEAQGVVRKFPEYEQLKAGRDSCIQHRTEVDSSLTEARSLIAAAGEAGAQTRDHLGDLQATGVEGWEILSERFRLAESKLHEAEVLISHVDRDLKELKQSASRATEAREEFDSISLDSSAWLQAIASNQVQMRAALTQMVMEGVRSLKSTEYLAPYPPEIARHRKRVESLLARAGGLDTSASHNEIGWLTNELEHSISSLEESTARPPPELTLAAEAFLNGQYARVLEVLAESDHSSAKVSAQTHLLQAAALLALFHSQGAMRPELLEAARKEVLSCQSFDEAVLNASPKIFSPRFIEFFEAQRALVVADTTEARN